jgi:hypothetical protein
MERDRVVVELRKRARYTGRERTTGRWREGDDGYGNGTGCGWMFGDVLASTNGRGAASCRSDLAVSPFSVVSGSSSTLRSTVASCGNFVAASKCRGIRGAVVDAIAGLFWAPIAHFKPRAQPRPFG